MGTACATIDDEAAVNNPETCGADGPEYRSTSGSWLLDRLHIRLARVASPAALVAMQSSGPSETRRIGAAGTCFAVRLLRLSKDVETAAYNEGQGTSLILSLSSSHIPMLATTAGLPRSTETRLAGKCQ